jgi:hypothetical protein
MPVIPATAGWVDGGRDQEDRCLKPAQANSLQDLSQKKKTIQQKNNTKQGWWSGSSGRVAA